MPPPWDQMSQSEKVYWARKEFQEFFVENGRKEFLFFNALEKLIGAEPERLDAMMKLWEGFTALVRRVNK